MNHVRKDTINAAKSPTFIEPVTPNSMLLQQLVVLEHSH